MTQIALLVSLYLSIVSASCTLSSNERKEKRTNDKKGVVKTYSDSFSIGYYNTVILPDSAECNGFNTGLKLILKNKKAVISYHPGGNKFFLKSRDLGRDSNLWTCNLPALFSKRNIGDTIVISALVYNLGGADNAIGNPTIIKKIGYHH